MEGEALSLPFFFLKSLTYNHINKNIMKRLKVNVNTYALFDYTPYLNGNWDEVPRPKKVTYDLGEVVYIKHSNAIGVVLGCIDEQGEEVRTDMDGMVSFSDLEPATKKHFELKDVHFDKFLKEDLFLEDRENNSQIIGMVTHIKANDFDFHSAKPIKKLHPLGTVFEKGSEGYVASGYDWWKFPIAKLSFIIDNH